MTSGLLLIAALNTTQPAIKPNSCQPVYKDQLTQNTLTLSRTQYNRLAIKEEEIKTMLQPQQAYVDNFGNLYFGHRGNPGPRPNYDRKRKLMPPNHLEGLNLPY